MARYSAYDEPEQDEDLIAVTKSNPPVSPSYFAPTGGLPAQTDLMTGRAVFTEAYAVIPKGVMRDIVTSYLPGWEKTRLWVLARPLSGFAETFSQYLMEVTPGGGSDVPENDPGAEAVLFVVEGELALTLDGKLHVMKAGGYGFIPPAQNGAPGTGRMPRSGFTGYEKNMKKPTGSMCPMRLSSMNRRLPRPRCRIPGINGQPHGLWTQQTCATTCMSR